MSWRIYHLLAGYDNGRVTEARDFYAPDLETAFRLARRQWPGASYITCEGSDLEP